ncbi:hypothetical protein [Hazenella coriacea]|uniref:Uncharacterized protein n=1 Tax=Hazenella coriacea TaxID=1179467 RepID=A0A4R3L744_9BACL|nr:hypothetical protein [Hazenella coriacea]TCS95741.1 hypothetical protein EDD58_102321 [Hazenella coriacea]
MAGFQKELNGKVSSITYEIGNNKKLGDDDGYMVVDVFVVEEYWASMTDSQKLSFVTVNGTKIPEGIESLQVLGKSSSVIVYFRSDEIQDVLARKKILNDKWYLEREDYPNNKKKDDNRRKKKGYGYWHR